MEKLNSLQVFYREKKVGTMALYQGRLAAASGGSFYAGKSYQSTPGRESEPACVGCPGVCAGKTGEISLMFPQFFCTIGNFTSYRTEKMLIRTRAREKGCLSATALEAKCGLCA